MDMKNSVKITQLGVGLILTLIFLSSCDKLKDKLFEAFTTGMTDVNVTIPIVTNTAGEGKTETLPVFINVDSIIKANTGGFFSLNSVSRIVVESADLTLSNADQANNMANFEYGILLMNTFNPQKNDWNSTMGIGRSDIPDSYASSINFAVVPDVNLKDHLQGTKLIYLYAYKARRPTTKALNGTIKMKIKIE